MKQQTTPPEQDGVITCRNQSAGDIHAKLSAQQ